MAQKRLMSELASLQKEKWVQLKVPETNVLVWKVGLMVVNPDSVWNGAYLLAEMRFTKDYPYQPPTFRFLTRGINHPNVYPDGKLCISILHTPGEDEQSGEQACERWSPLQGVESVLRSVLLLLDDPETSSPANVDASITFRKTRDLYDAQARMTAAHSRRDVPDGVCFPTQADLEPVPQLPAVDDDFWNESDDDGDFGSESDVEDFGADDDDEIDDDDDDDD